MKQLERCISATALALAVLAAGCGGTHGANGDADGGVGSGSDPGSGGGPGSGSDPGGGSGSGSAGGLPSAHAAQVVAGRLHACALTTTGSVRCWGYGEQGQLGDGTPLGTTDRFLPVQVSGLTAGVLAIAASPESDFTCAITASRGVRCWGDGEFGQLGNGARANAPTPVDVTGLAGVTSLAVGSTHACAVIAGGAVKCWGAGDYGDLGNGGRDSVTTPVAVIGLTGATAVAAGRGQSCAITASTGVACWGSNIDGEAGVGLDPAQFPALDSPTTISGLTGVTQLTAGGLDTCAIANGAALCWGNNEQTELGNGTGGSSFDLSTVPVTVTGLAGLTDLDAAGSFGLAVLGGAVKVWGEFTFAQQSTPAAAPALPEAATSVSGGGEGYACAIGASGAVYCWGDNEAGTVGYYDPNAGAHYEAAPLAIQSLP